MGGNRLKIGQYLYGTRRWSTQSCTQLVHLKCLCTCLVISEFWRTERIVKHNIPIIPARCFSQKTLMPIKYLYWTFYYWWLKKPSITICNGTETKNQIHVNTRKMTATLQQSTDVIERWWPTVKLYLGLWLFLHLSSWLYKYPFNWTTCLIF